MLRNSLETPSWMLFPTSHRPCEVYASQQHRVCWSYPKKHKAGRFNTCCRIQNEKSKIVCVTAVERFGPRKRLNTKSWNKTWTLFPNKNKKLNLQHSTKIKSMGGKRRHGPSEYTAETGLGHDNTHNAPLKINWDCMDWCWGIKAQVRMSEAGLKQKKTVVSGSKENKWSSNKEHQSQQENSQFLPQS